MIATLGAVGACTIDSTGRILWGKDIHQGVQAASTIKLLSAITARDWIDLASTVAPYAEDLADSRLEPGDVLTWGDCIHAALMESDNGAARTIANQAHPAGADALLAAMRAKGDALGWSGHVIMDAVGGGTSASIYNRVSAWQMATLVRHVHSVDPWLYATAGTRAYLMPVTGVRTGHILLTHTTNLTDMPGFESGKSGTGSTTQRSAVWAWALEGRRYFSAVMQSATRREDMGAMVDDVIAATSRRRIVAGLI